MASLNLTVEHPTRLCVVHKVFGIVEFKDSVKRIDPTEIIFRDETTDILYQIDKDEEIRKRIIQGPSAKGEAQ